MKAWVIEKPGHLAQWDIPEPVPGPKEALVQVTAISLCNGTDRKALDGTFVYCSGYPTVLGHEVVGRVIALGPEVTRYKLGDVVIRPGVGQGLVPGLKSCFGGFVEKGIVKEDSPPHQVIPIEMKPEDAVMTITLKETYSIVQQLGAGPGVSVVIAGTGPVGVCLSFWAKLMGAGPVIVIGRRDAACKRAEELGRADMALNNTKEHVPGKVKALLGDGADMAIEAIGHEGIIADLVEVLKPDGRCALYGVSPTIEAQSAYRDDPRVASIGAHEEEVHDEVFGLIRDGKVIPGDFISHVLSFDEVPLGYDLLARREALKIAFLL